MELDVTQSSSPGIVGVIECAADKTTWNSNARISAATMQTRRRGSKRIEGASARGAREFTRGFYRERAE